jgi:DGQHR domain-containing protein
MTRALKFPCLLVQQNLGTFYVFVAPTGEILPLLTVERRGLTEEAQRKVQRALDDKRQKEIATYVLQPDATFPTSITLNADSDFVHLLQHQGEWTVVWGEETEEARDNTLKVITDEGDRFFQAVPDGRRPGEIIDGQHRFEGLRLALREAGAEERMKLEQFQIPFALMQDLSAEACAKIFVTINSTQRKVDGSHIADLFGLSTKRSPKRSAHLIARSLDRMEGSPFENGLKILGKKADAGEMLSQGSFVKYFLKLISSNPDRDEQQAQQGLELKRDPHLPLRDFYLDDRDSELLALLHNFFNAVARAYPDAWKQQPSEYLLRKTVGYSAMMGLLKLIAGDVVAASPSGRSLAAFDTLMAKIKASVPESSWRRGAFTSSEAAAGKMTKMMFEAVEGKVLTLLEENSAQPA